MEEPEKINPSLPFLYASAFLAASLLWYAGGHLRRRGLHPRLPPGPRGLPVVGSLPFLDPELHTYFASLASTHGPILSLHLGLKLGVVVSSPSLAREVLRDHDPAFANRDVPAAGLVLAYGGSDIVWTPNGPTWRMLRKVCVREVLGGHTLAAVYGLRRREVRAMVGRMRARAGEAVDVGTEMFEMVMNVITSMLWGGGMEEEREGDADGGVGEEFRQLVTEITGLLGLPNVSDFFPALRWMDLQGVERKMWTLMERFDGIFEKIIKTRVGSGGGDGGGGGKDFLDVLLQMEKVGGDGKTPFTMTHVKALLMDMVVGGTETTSNTVEWALAEMMNKPETLAKAQAELDEVVGKDTMVEESHALKLPYLNAVIKEALRLHPALPLLVPHCPSEPSTIGGYLVPEGSRVFVNAWAIHRDPAVWEAPAEFRPERFLGEGGERWDYSGNDFGYFPFGSGRRICAGIAMAERMMSFALATLVHSFEWGMPEGERVGLEERFGIVLKKAEPLRAVPTPRLADPDLYV